MAHVLACKRIPVISCPARIPLEWIENLEHNQRIASCCRHPENHDVEAWYSNEQERFRNGREQPPDIYIFHCTCGRVHRRFEVGGGPRPYWEIR